MGMQLLCVKNMNLIFKFRNDVGLSQESLAKAIGVTQSAISQLECGKKKPSVDLAMRLISFAKEQGKSFKLEDFYASYNDSIEHAN